MFIALLLVLIMTAAGFAGFVSGFRVRWLQSLPVLFVLILLDMLAALVFFPACQAASNSPTLDVIATMLGSAAVFTAILLCLEGALIARFTQGEQ